MTSIVEHVEGTGHLPDVRTVTVEQREGAVTLNTCAGSKINETL